VIYLDNSATSMPKPRKVKQAMAWAVEHYASPGRGSSRASEQAEELLFSLRQEAAEMFDCDWEQVVLTTSATHGLNIAIKSLVGRGDRVVISGMEHNAVVRPLYAIGAEVHVARSTLFDRKGLLEAFDRLLTVDTRLCVMTHVSNVFGWVLPVEEVAFLCKQRGIPFVLDASQSAGILPVQLRKLEAAFIAFPGHKGLLGPQGTGLLLCGHETKTLLEGGTGSVSREKEMPDFLPDRLEPGTHNMPGAAGLLEGLRYVRKRGLPQIAQEEAALKDYGASLLEKIPEIEVFQGECQTGVLSFRPRTQDCVLFCEKLSKKWDIALRAGLHCAPLAHETAGTLDTGTIRLSVGPMSERWQLKRLAKAVETLINQQEKL
jgi:cysteine desulfurase family protein